MKWNCSHLLDNSKTINGGRNKTLLRLDLTFSANNTTTHTHTHMDMCIISLSTTYVPHSVVHIILMSIRAQPFFTYNGLLYAIHSRLSDSCTHTFISSLANLKRTSRLGPRKLNGRFFFLPNLRKKANNGLAHSCNDLVARSIDDVNPRDWNHILF